jgi:hypothetical protein
MEIARNGRPGLADAHGHGGGMRCSAGEGGDGESFGQVLEQVNVRPGEDRGHCLGDRPVVDRVGQAVGAAGGPEVELEIQVHLEGLSPVSFLRQGAMGPEDP